MGKKMKKSLGLTALVVAVSLCLSACGGSSSSAVSYTHLRAH